MAVLLVLTATTRWSDRPRGTANGKPEAPGSPGTLGKLDGRKGRFRPARSTPPAPSLPGTESAITEASPPPGLCRGVVKSEESGAPISGARVVLGSADARFRVASTTTGPDGEFELKPPGVDAPLLLVLAAGHAPSEVPTRLDSVMEVRLSRGVTIEGAVTTSGRRSPVDGAEVEVRGWYPREEEIASDGFLLAPESLRPGGFLNWSRCQTDRAGRFRATGLLGRWFRITVGKPGFLPRPFLGESPWPNVIRATESPLDLRLTPVRVCAWQVEDARSGESVEQLGWIVENSDLLVSPPPDLLEVWPKGPHYWLCPDSMETANSAPVADRLTVHFNRVGYKPARVEIVPVPYDRDRPPSPTRVRLEPAGAGVGSIEVRVERPAWGRDVPVAVRIRPAEAPSNSISRLVLLENGSPVRTSLPAGEYSIQVISEADRMGLVRPAGQGVRAEHRIRIVAGECVRLGPPLTGGMLEIEVSSRSGRPVEGATMFLARDGVTSGWGLDRILNPLPGVYRVQLTPGQHEIVLEKPGFMRASAFVQVLDQAAIRLSLTLDPDGG